MNATHVKWIKYIAMAVSMLWAGWWTFFGLVAGIGEGFDLIGIFMHTLMPGILYLAATLIAWRWHGVGGVLLIILSIWTFNFFGFARMTEGFMLLAFPPILAGILFCILWYQERLLKLAQHST